jgi:hypothetical protein
VSALCAELWNWLGIVGCSGGGFRLGG